MAELVAQFNPERDGNSSPFPISKPVAKGIIDLYQAGDLKLAQAATDASQRLRSNYPQTARVISGTLDAYDPLNRPVSRQQLGLGSGVVCKMIEGMLAETGIEEPDYDKRFGFNESAAKLKAMEELFTTSEGEGLGNRIIEERIKGALRDRQELPLLNTLYALGGQNGDARRELLLGGYIALSYLSPKQQKPS